MSVKFFRKDSFTYCLRNERLYVFHRVYKKWVEIERCSRLQVVIDKGTFPPKGKWYDRPIQFCSKIYRNVTKPFRTSCTECLLLIVIGIMIIGGVSLIIAVSNQPRFRVDNAPSSLYIQLDNTSIKYIKAERNE